MLSSGKQQAEKSNLQGWGLSAVDTIGDRVMTKPDQPPNTAQGPHSSDQAKPKPDLDFDTDSPDLEDPQVDPQGPAIAPKDSPKRK